MLDLIIVSMFYIILTHCMIHTFVLFLRALSLHMFIYIYICVHIEKNTVIHASFKQHMLFHAFILPSYYFDLFCLCFLHTQWKRNKAKSTLLNVTTDGSKDCPIHWHCSAFFLWNFDVLAGSYHMFKQTQSHSKG